MATKKKLKLSKKKKGNKTRVVYRSKEMDYDFPMDLKAMKKRRKKMMTNAKT